MVVPKAIKPINRMHEVHGTSTMNYCRRCCNYQKIEKGSKECICIAYSNTAPWEGDWKACEELFNYPFRALRPRQNPLEEFCMQKKQKKTAKIIKGQMEIDLTAKADVRV